MKAKTSTTIYNRILRILESARSHVSRSVNTTQVAANWLIGREIVEEEQKGRKKAAYGKALLQELAALLTADFGPGFSETNLRWFRQFYIEHPSLLPQEIHHAPRDKSASSPARDGSRIHHALRDESSGAFWLIGSPSPAKPWMPGLLHPNLFWTHYRTLLRVEKPEARSFYEVEALQNNWAARELERQINSLLYERLALSKDKEGLIKLATKGQQIQRPADVFKDPVVMEFLGLPASPKLVESELEEALINNLVFLLELGKGFAFVARQQRITLEGDHFYVDLIFYHAILKCYILIDLKVGKLTHNDLGQMQLYVNYFDEKRRIADDNPSLGLILCTDKNEAVVKYTLGESQQDKIFASRYKLYLPTEAELKAELRREIKVIAQTSGGKP